VNFDASGTLSKPQNSRSSREYVRNTIEGAVGVDAEYALNNESKNECA